MYIKPNQSIAPIDRKPGKSTVRKTAANPDDASFIDILDEIDVIEISALEEEKNFDEKESKDKKPENKTIADSIIKIDEVV